MHFPPKLKVKNCVYLDMAIITTVTKRTGPVAKRVRKHRLTILSKFQVSLLVGFEMLWRMKVNFIHDFALAWLRHRSHGVRHRMSTWEYVPWMTHITDAALQQVSGSQVSRWRNLHLYTVKAPMFHESESSGINGLFDSNAKGPQYTTSNLWSRFSYIFG